MPLTDAEIEAAHAAVLAWREDPKAELACPRCGARALVVEDRSARPHTEWYALTCAACGLDDAIAIALGAPPPSLDG